MAKKEILMCPELKCRAEAVDEALDERSLELRRLVVRALSGSRQGHIGASMSLMEVVRVLYDDVLRFRLNEPEWVNRDRFILSKGHGCLALYAILADKGFIPEEELLKFCAFDGLLGGHPESAIPGVEASTGSLGHGLSIGVGMALYAKIYRMDYRVFTLLGDGECNEGSIWEAALGAAKHRLDNLVAIVDYNKSQAYGPTYDVLDLEPLADKWKSFGFGVCEADGHDVNALRETFSAAPLITGKPTAVICHTVKGKGISFAENNMAWHHKNKIGEAEIRSLLEALES